MGFDWIQIDGVVVKWGQKEKKKKKKRNLDLNVVQQNGVLHTHALTDHNMGSDGHVWADLAREVKESGIQFAMVFPFLLELTFADG